MTGPRSPQVHPHRTRARPLLPFLAAIILSPMACTEQPTAPQMPGAPNAAVTRSHPYLPNRSSQTGAVQASSVRAVMSSAPVSGAMAATTAVTGPKVLIVSDLNGPTTTALANSIADAGFHVGVTQAPEYNWFGTNPAPADYDVVIHLNGATYNLPLSSSAQSALTSFVSSGGGFVGSQWNGFEESQGQQTGMSDLILLGSSDEQGQNCGDCDVTYNTVAGQESHPLLAGLPSSFTFHADGHDASPKLGSDALVLMRVPDGGPAVLAREVGSGKVVNFSFAPNYGLTGSSGMLMDSQVQQLYVNAVRWLSGTSGTPGSGTLDSDADGVVDGSDNCVNAANADQGDTDADGIGNACDPDADGDGVLDVDDNCELYNPDQADVNGNWIGDACEEVQTQAQTITFAPLADRTILETPFSVAATASSGLTVTFLSSGTCSIDGSTVTLNALGTCTIIAQQGGDASYSAAATVQQSFTITKAPATLGVGTEYTFDGQVKQATVTTSPAGLTGVSLTYTLDGLPVANPTNAGVYQVSATLDNPVYEAAPASGTLTIHQAAPVLTWASPAAITFGTPLGSTQLNATASGVGGTTLSGTFVYLPAEGAVLPVGTRPISVEFIPSSGNYTHAITTVSITVVAVQAPPSSLKFTGFFRPVHNLPVANTMSAGRAVPVSFSVEGAGPEPVLQAGSPTSVEVSCSADESQQAVTTTFDVAASRLVRVGNIYTYLWKTNASWEGTCRRLVLTLVDGSRHEALFRFAKASIPPTTRRDEPKSNHGHGSNDKPKKQEKQKEKKQDRRH